MSVFLRVDINIVAMVLLGLVYAIAYRRLDKQDLLNKVFLRVSLIIFLQLLFETLTCVINKRPEQFLIPVSLFLHVCLFTTAPVLTYCWLLLIKNVLDFKTTGLRKSDVVLMIPVVINIVLSVLSPFYKFAFYIDDANVYHRGVFFTLTAAITYFYFVYGLILIMKNKRKMVRQEFIIFHIFGIIPMIGGVVQALFYGALLMWSSVAFSLLILYMLLQQRMVQLDDLTGAWNRNSFEGYISKSIKQSGNQKIGLIYVDIDRLKQINDAYGHLEGDFAIKAAINAIRSVIRKNDVIVRMGGDEFVIILNGATEAALNCTISRIEAALEEYNKNTGKAYKLECSFGADVFHTDYDSIDKFLHHIDSLMYCNKKKKKEQSESEQG